MELRHGSVSELSTIRAKSGRPTDLPKSTTLVLPPAFEDAHRIPDAERP
jgi:hypothetical protein